MTFEPSQPLVSRNDYRSLTIPALGEWSPSLSVSVVIPTWRAEVPLPFVLAGLAAQSYPAHLLEVVVVDDGNAEPVVLPEVRPERTRLVRVTQGWGRANACHTGAMNSDGDVIHWLDSDMVAHREHVEAQLRWHHTIDYAVVIGAKRFVEPAGLLGRDPAEVRDVIADGGADTLFDFADSDPHKWVEGNMRRTEALAAAGSRAFRIHVGATGSLHRSLYLDAGGMDTSLNLGEDMELGYRLAEAGAVLVPDMEARSWHLGRSHVMDSRDAINRHNDSFLTNLVPGMRAKRNRRGRTYERAYLEVVVPMDADADRVMRCVDSVLDSDLQDVRVVVVGPWSQISDERRSALADPMLEPRIVARSYARDPRVSLVESLGDERCEATYRLELSTSEFAPLPAATLAMLEDVERTHEAGRRLLDGDRVVAVLRSTAARSRAALVGADTAEEIDGVVAAAFGSQDFALAEAGWVPTCDRDVERYEGKLKTPVDPAESRHLMAEALSADFVRPAEAGPEEPSRRGIFRRR